LNIHPPEEYLEEEDADKSGSPGSIDNKIRDAIHKVSNLNTSKKSQDYTGEYIGESGSGSWNTEAKRGKEEFKQDPLID